MNSILEHEIDEVGVWLNKFIQLLKVSKFASFLLIENVEAILVGI